MKRRMIISILCFMLLFINTSMTSQAQEISDDAVASVTDDKGTVTYYTTLDTPYNAGGAVGAMDAAGKSPGSTLTLLKDVTLYSGNKNLGDYIEETSNITFDFNGRILNIVSASSFIIKKGTICFTDSSQEPKGGINGSSEILLIEGGNVTIEAGHYIANTWACNIDGGNVTIGKEGGTGPVMEAEHVVDIGVPEGNSVTILGGTFSGIVYNNSSSGTVQIQGGTFEGNNAYGTYASIYNQGKMTITGGSFKTKDSGNGIDNQGTLYLKGGRIVEDAENSGYGVRNRAGATLYLNGTVEIDASMADFLIEEPMIVGASLEGNYSVTANISSDESSQDKTTITFAKAGEDVTLDKGNFQSALEEYYIDADDNGSECMLVKCNHDDSTKISSEYVCGVCGVQMCAQVGEKYYATFADAFEAVKNVKPEEAVVKVLIDVEEDIQVKGGTFALDLNGKTITGRISVSKGNVTICGSGKIQKENSRALDVSQDGTAEIKGCITVEGKGEEGGAIYNSGNLKINGENVNVIGTGDYGVSNGGIVDMLAGKVYAKKWAFMNMGGTVNLIGGEVTAEMVAVLNYAGTVRIGAEDGTGPTLSAKNGLINNSIALADVETLHASAEILGGEMIADIDIQNKGGDTPEGYSLLAGTVTLKGGTFINGLTVEVDEGADLNDLLAEGYGYYDNLNKKVDVSDGRASLNGTITVQKSTALNGSDGGTASDGDAEEIVNDDDDVNDVNDMNGNVVNADDVKSRNYAEPADTGDISNISMWIFALITGIAGVKASRARRVRS